MNSAASGGLFPAGPGRAEFSVWAPAASRAEVWVDGQLHPMRAGGRGWWRASVAHAGPAARYAFRLDGGDLLADPRSPRQPDGPDQPGQLYDHSAFCWNDEQWRGRDLRGCVIYELHTGTFTAQGTLDAAIGQLDYLRALGVDIVELMPLAAFPGRHGWGYDGISLWAVHEPYGGPDALKRFVAACHARDIGVVLDVVYNHVGLGNRLADFGPYFTDAYRTPWGPAVNLDRPGSDEVRQFIVANALMWLRDYHVDGLRLDAVHALADSRATHLLEELSVAVAALGSRLNRKLLLIAESEANDPRLVTPVAEGGYGLSAQWSDDFHHALHAALTGERQGYYCDFGTMAALAKTLATVFLHDGTWSDFRGQSHGRPVPTRRIPAEAFIGFLQDHDQVGNRAIGDRISASLPLDLLKLGAGLLLTSPFTPMLFMGEEWGSKTPWQYFTDHPDTGLGRAVADGRRAEFARHGWRAADVPDPQDPATFERSKLDWSRASSPDGRDLLAWYRELIRLRRSRPELTDPRLDLVGTSYDEGRRWLVLTRGRIRVAANFGDEPQRLPVGVPHGLVLAASKAGACLTGDGSVLVPAAAIAVVLS
jgi:malto-oligosyltrehalose trehalohydrolase